MIYALMTSDGKKELPPWFNGSWREREAAKPKCDGNHGGAPCGDPGCWNDTRIPPRHMNPHCIGLHDRTSYSINTCDKCRLWSDPPPPDAPATPPHHPV